MDIDSIFFDWHGDPQQGVSVVAGEFIVVTSDGTDYPGYQALASLLNRIRRGLALDVVFVSQILDGQPQVRYPYVDEAASQCDPLEEVYGQELLGATPDEVLAAPVAGREGWIYGTVCCLQQPQGGPWGDRSQAQALQSVARLVASTLDDALAPLTSGFAALAPVEVPAPRTPALAA